MKAADQQRAAIAGLSVGNAVVMGAALAGLGTGGRHIGESELRSQDMELALMAMPADMGGFSKATVGSVK